MGLTIISIDIHNNNMIQPAIRKEGEDGKLAIKNKLKFF